MNIKNDVYAAFNLLFLLLKMCYEKKQTILAYSTIENRYFYTTHCVILIPHLFFIAILFHYFLIFIQFNYGRLFVWCKSDNNGFIPSR